LFAPFNEHMNVIKGEHGPMTKNSSSYGLRSASIGAVALIGVAAGCSTEQTQATDTWRDPSYVAGPMKNIVIIGARLNDTDRRTLEDGFAAALSAHGTRATPSYTVLPNPLPSKEAARTMVQQGGYDGVLVSTLKGVNDSTAVIGGAGFWDGYYRPGWGEPYVVNDPVVRFETSLWDPAGAGKMIWSTVTQTEGPSTGKDFTASLTKTVVPMMEKAGLIPPAPGQAVSLLSNSPVR
jgi:hypothetical protein